MHSDFTVNASLLVKQELHRLVFSNPGTLLVSRDQYYAGGESVCRNKSLQKMFSMLGVAEKAGSGTDKIMKGWREANWRSPKIEEQQIPDKVVLTMPMESFLSEESKASLIEKFGFFVNSFDHNVLSTLALACDEGYVTNIRLRYSLNLHKSEITDLLKLMTVKGLLVSEGYGRGTRYFLPANSIDILKEKASNVATSDANVATSECANVATSDSNVVTSECANVATSDSNVVTTGDKKVIPIKKRMPREELHGLILNNCQKWISLEELATVIQRNPIYLRNHVMPVLLASQKIEMMYPNNPNHPKQQYKIKN